MIEINNLTKRYKDIIALDDITLKIENREFFGLLGPNGAGKSTTMNLLVGYITPDKGEIKFDGEKITNENLSVRRKFGLVPQSIALYDEISAVENLKIFGSFYAIPKNELKEIIGEKLNSVGLYERRKDLVKTYSGGMKRRLNLISAMLHSPEILLCDEPTVGVDPQSRNSIFEYLQKLNREGITIIYTTHYMEEAERLCTRIAIIDIGKIIALGTPEELINMLPYKETISFPKNITSKEKINLFNNFGILSSKNEHYELKMDEKTKLSEFFLFLEQNDINHKFIDFHKPTLEELFLNLTGRRLRD
jgi:ABC-2 type transport system ATP-binding protein